MFNKKFRSAVFIKDGRKQEANVFLGPIKLKRQGPCGWLFVVRLLVRPCVYT
jgi:hypothetical protein